MSRAVDTRIAEMRFDNKDFEANVAQSMSTLDKLKQSLNFGDAGKAFDGISKAAAGVNIGGIGDAIDTVKEKFSALEIAGITALVNLTNKAVDAGAQMVKSLTIDQVTAGWDKYAEKTTAVQTIMAATKKEFSDEEQQMEYVNEQLDKLNWFTDETSFNLVDMVSNIGKFTNAGIKLDDAVTSMQGVATWAAISGANATEASRAMYNLSQAMSAGYMKLIDWKSIENANMATMEFKEMAIQAGLAAGTLKQVGDEIQTVNTGLAAKFSGMTVTAENMAGTLSDAWLTRDVMNQVLDMYGGFTDALNAAYNETGLETIKLLKYIEDYENGLFDMDKVMKETGLDADRLTKIFSELSSPTYELGRRAFKAAQETKTFAEVIAYTKDAVSSGWMNTFEIIFGDYKEAKEMWSDLSEVFYEIFVASGDARNEMLSAWKELGGRTSMLEAVSNAYGAIVKVVETVKEAFHDIFPEKDSEAKGLALFNLTERVREFTEKLMLSGEAAEKLKKAITPVFSVLKKGLDIIRGVGAEIRDTFVPAFTRLLNPVKQILSSLGRLTTTFKDLIKYAIEPLLSAPKDIWSGFKNGIPGLIAGFEDIADKVSIWLTNFNETLLTSEKVQKAVQKIRDIFEDIRVFLGDFLNLSVIIQTYQQGGGGIAGVIAVISDKLGDVWNLIVNIVKDISGIDISDGIIGKIADGISGALDKIREAFDNFRKVDTSGVDKVRDDAEKKLGPVASLFEGIKKVLAGVWEFLKKLAPLFSTVISLVGTALGKLGDAIGGAMDNMDASTIVNLANGGILAAIALGIKKLVDWLKDLKDGLGIFDKLKEAIEPITGVLDAARGALEAWQQNLKASTLLKLAGAIGVITASVLVLSEIDPEKLTTALTAITVEFGELLGSMSVLSKIMTGMDTKGMKAAALVMIEMAAAVLILSSAVKSLAALEWDDMIKGLAGVGVICYELSRTLKSLDLDGLSFAKGVGLILFATSIKILASAVKQLSKLSWGEMIEGLTGVGLILMELRWFLNNTDLSGMSVSTSAGILILAASIKILASAVKQMSQLSWGEMIEGLVGVGVLLIELRAFLNNTDLSGMSISKSVGILVLAASLKVLASAVKQISELSWGEMIEGLVGMGAVLVEIFAFMKLLESTGMSGGQLILISAGMIVMGAALEIVTDVMQKLGSMDILDLIQSIAGLAAVMAILALGMIGMQEALPGAAALLVVAVALQVLNPVLQDFASMEWMEILKSLAELAGVFVILGVAGAVLGPLTPVILALAAAVVVLGVGITAIGAGVALIGAGLEMTAAAGVAAVQVLIYALEHIIQMIPDFVVAVGEAIIAFIQLIGDSAMEIAEAVIKVGKAILLTLKELIPDLIETVVTIIDDILQTLVEHGPSIIESVMSLLMMLLESLTENLPQLIDFVVNALLELITGITEHIPEFVQAGFDIVIGLIDGLGEALVENAPRLMESLLNFLGNLLKAVLAFFGIHSPSTVFADIGEKLILGLIQGITGLITGAVRAIKSLASKLVSGIKEKLHEFKEKGKELVEKIKTGISDKAEELKTKMTETITAVKQKIADKVADFKEKGKELITKIRDGMTDEQKEVFDKAVETVKGIRDNIGEKLSWFKDKGGEIMDALKSGSSSQEKLDALNKVFTNTITEVKDGIKKKIDDFVNIGKDILDGLIKGVQDAWAAGSKKVTEVWDGFVGGVKDFFGIHSPSTVMAEIGENLDKGLIVGIAKDAREVVKAAVNMGTAVTKATQNVVSGAVENAAKKSSKIFQTVFDIPVMPELANDSWDDLIETSLGKMTRSRYFDEIGIPVMPMLAEDTLIERIADAAAQAESADIELTVTPVADMSEIESEIDGTYEVSIADIAKINMSGYENIQNAIKGLDSDMEKHVTSLRDDLAEFKDIIKKFKVIMDTGALVGALTEPLDEALGQREILAGRGVT